MSRTQVDLSPLTIDRTQDITHWLEGDVTGLSTRDKQRYQRRKTAIEDYFKTELSVEKLSTRYRLSAEEESLEEMARRCFMLHEDGQPWGFRALVPGVKVMDHITTPEAGFSDSVDMLCDEVQVLSPDVVAGEAFENEDTAKRQVLKPAAPSGGEEEYEQTVTAKTELLEIEAVAETVDVQRDEGAKSIQEDEEAEQVAVSEEGVVVTGEAEVSTDTNVSLDEPREPHQAEDQSIEMAAQIEPAECELAMSADVIIDPPGQPVEEAEDTNVPTTKLSELDAPSDVTEQAAEVVEVAAEQPEGELVEAAVELAEQMNTPVESPEDVSVEANTVLEPVEMPEVPAEEIEEDVVESVNEQQAEEIEEKTVASASEQHTEEMEEEAVEVTNECTEVLEEDGAEVEEDTQELKAAGDEALAESAKALGEETLEIEQEESDAEEERRGRVAAASTIVVPCVMLEALERAEKQAILEEAETVETSAIASNQVTEKSEQLVTTSAQETEEKEQSAAPGEPTVEVQSRASGQLNVLQLLKTPIRSLAGESRLQIPGSQAALLHLVRRRWIKRGKRKLQQRWIKIVSAAVIVTTLVFLLVPLCIGLVGYSTYTNIRNVANDGLSHLMALKSLIPADKSDITSALNSKQLADAKVELSKAQDDFLQLQEMVNRPDIQSLLQQFAPQYSSKLGMARHLVQVALDVSYMGQELIGVAQLGANLIHAGSLFASNKPLISANDINSIEAALVHGQYYINDIQAQMSQVDIAQLPFGSATQKAQLSRYLKMIPQVQGMIEQVQGLMGPVSWLLGVGQPRHLLVQTLDRGELRPSGGFEGQYGILTLQDGRLSPFTLKDIAKLDYGGNGNELGNHPPAQYKWMDFGNFGVRDANLSADFPTTAKLVMQLFQQEGGGPVDGDIQVTPVVIEQLLQITGPLHIKEYNETITAQNLEDKLHAYQQNYTLISVQQQITGTDTHQTRKAFTNLVGSLLLDRAKHLQPKQLIDLGKLLLKDLKSRDLQVYFNNPVAEQWLAQNNYSGAMPQFTKGIDGFMVVQANVSISKAAQFVHSTFNDQVMLDAQGGATHNLTITLNYQQTGPIYGFNSYADYLRVYAPSNAQLRYAYGFNTGQVLCTPNQTKPKPNPNPNPNPNPGPPPPGGTDDSSGSYTDAGIRISGCGTYYHMYPDSDYRSCSDGNYQLGYNGMQAKAWPVQRLGAPKQLSSDLPGYSMWGGMTLTPKNCVSTITLQWYVPHVVQNQPGQSPYQVIVGHQAGWPVTAQVHVDASALKGVKSLSYNQKINVDTLIALAARPMPNTPRPTTPTPGVTPTTPAKRP